MGILIFSLICFVIIKICEKRDEKRFKKTREIIENDPLLKRCKEIILEEKIQPFLKIKEIRYVLEVTTDIADVPGKVIFGEKFAYILLGKYETIIRQPWKIVFELKEKKEYTRKNICMMLIKSVCFHTI